MNLVGMDDNKLLQLYLNCMEAVRANKPNAAKALELVKEINGIWQQRLSAAIDHQYKADTPEVGLLKTLGYRVGNSGEKEKRRREILDMVMSQILPFVGSPAYMHEWGAPFSRERYRKLHRVLTVFRSSAQRFGNMEAAVEHWGDDLLYIEQVWKQRVI